MKKIDIHDWVVTNPIYVDHYEPFFEESDVRFILNELKDEDREKYIKLEKKQNPVHFKEFIKENPELFK